jgi:hypothetical protein
MNPALVQVLLSLGLRFFDYMESRGETLTPEELEQRTLLRKEVVRRAREEGSREASD